MTLLDKMKGCMVGAVLGDCLGSPVECRHWSGISRKKVAKRFARYEEEGGSGGESAATRYRYTDDTAMARQLAASLVQNKGVDARDMAGRFVREYFDEPWRGYGESVSDVFRKLKVVLESEGGGDDVFKPASEQFEGQGSYGNGAAMRVHPVGLFARSAADAKALALLQGRLTHSHPDGVNGAAAQAMSVRSVLRGVPSEEMLCSLASALPEFGDRIGVVRRMLEDDEEDGDPAAFGKKLVEELGNDVSAARSVPSAIYCFVRAKEPVEGLCEGNGFQRTLELAMTLGGDTDTIMSMAGALAGAHYGVSSVPSSLAAICEGVEEAEELAVKLHGLA